MLLRFIFPYILLALIIIVYICFRHRKLGPIIMRVNRVLFSRYNLDSLLLIIIFIVVSYFLSGLELQTVPADRETSVFGQYTQAYFYIVLILCVIAREVEKPAIREKGISTPRGFYRWSEVSSFQWTKNTVNIVTERNNKKRSETWEVETSDKKKLDQTLKDNVRKSSKRLKKKSR